MKKLLFVFSFLAVALIPSLSAQNTADTLAADTQFTPWRVGIALGGTYNFHQAPQAYTNYFYRGIPGLEVGVSGKYYFNTIPWLALRADLLMVMKNYVQGNNVIMDGEEVGTFSTVHINNYALLPVMADFYYGKRVKFHCGLGFYVGYWMSWKRSGSNGMPITTDDLPTYDETTTFSKVRDNRFNAGAAASLGVSFPMGKHLEGSADVNCFYDLTDSKKVYSRNHFPQYNTTLSLQLGLSYKF